MSCKQWRQGRWRKERWRERLRWGAQTPMTRLRGAGSASQEVFLQEVSFFRHEGGGLAVRPPAKAFTPSPLTLLTILGLLALALSLPSYAQSAPIVAVSGPPDVLVIVYQQPGGADQVDVTYARTIPHAQAARDYQALTQAAGWPVSTHRIQDVAAPMQSRSGPMTSIVFQALGVVQDSAHTFPIQTFAQAFRTYKRINVIFFVGPQFQFQGPRSYADTNIRMTLDQRGTTYVYAVEILNSQMTQMPPLGAVPPAAGHRSPGLLLLGIFGVAALAGLAVYLLTARLVAKAPPKENSKDADRRIEAGTRR